MELWKLTATQASQRMAEGSLTSEAYTQACLERISQRERQVFAWAHLDSEYVMSQARVCDRTPRRSALHGIPIGFKDVIRTKDFPTTFNSPIYAGHKSNEDAHVVSVLRSKGAIVMGKTQTLEFACGGNFPATHNPWDLNRTPGGSSSGSGAAVADGMVPLALGTQTGGSTIRPAAFCGVYGMKPTWGRIPFDGIKSFSPALDTVGFFGRRVDDIGLLLEAFSLSEYRPSPKRDPKTLRLGICQTPYWSQAESQAQLAFNEQVKNLRGQGVHIEEISWPKEFDEINRWQDEIMQDGGRYAFWPEMLHSPDILHDDFKAKLRNHLGLSAQQMRTALDSIARCRHFIETSLEGLDAAISLSAPGVAPLGLQTQGMATFNRLWTALHMPCLNIPALWSKEGLPMGLQLIAPRYEDQSLVEIAQVIAELLDEGKSVWS